MLPRTFITERLHAEALCPEDLPAVHQMHLDGEQMAYLGGIRTAEQTAQYIARNLAHWERYGFGLWLLRDRSEPADGGFGRLGSVVGRVLLRHLELEGVDEIEVGYSLAPACWGKGLAAEAAAACLGLARDVLRTDSIVALTAPANLRSHQVLRKIGMVLERQVLYEGSPQALFRTLPT
ncbi:MAG: GNAT family N-acetyltransferase [Thermoanaerobaculia bacterium]